MFQFQAEYGQAANFYLPVIKAGSNNFAVGADWTPAAGDVKISIDGGTAANITTLPTAITMGNGAIWKFALSAAELTGAKIAVTVVDAATKAVEDQSFVVGTRDHPSALDPRFVRRAATAQAGAAQSITLDASANASDDAYNGHFLQIVGGTGVGQGGYITDYTGSSKVATMERAWVVEPDSTSRFVIFPGMLGATLLEQAGAVFDLATSGHTTAGTFGEAVVDTLTAADTTIPNLIGTPAADLSADLAAVKADTAATLEDTGTTLPAQITAGVDSLTTDVGTVQTGVTSLLGTDQTYKKNTAVPGFSFYLETDAGVPATGKTVTAEISKDGGAFASPVASVAEVSDGWYTVDLSADEMNADEIAFIANALNCRQTNIKLRTQS